MSGSPLFTTQDTGTFDPAWMNVVKCPYEKYIKERRYLYVTENKIRENKEKFFLFKLRILMDETNIALSYSLPVYEPKAEFWQIASATFFLLISCE